MKQNIFYTNRFKNFTLLFILLLTGFSPEVFSQSSYVIYAISNGNPSIINRINTDGTGESAIYTAPNNSVFVYSIAVDASESKLYYYLDNSGFTAGQIIRCDLNGLNSETFLDVSSEGGVSGLAAGGGYLYYTPYNSKTLVKISSDKSTSDVLFTATNYVSHVALDLPNNLIFFVDFGGTYNIYRSNLDGSGNTTIYSGGGSNAIFGLSAGNGYVFFSTGGSPSHDLFRINNNGTGFTSVYTPGSGSVPYSAYDTGNQNLYFFPSSGLSIYKANSTGTGSSIIKNVGTSLGGYGYNLATAPNTLLPVELSSFTAESSTNGVLLKWKTDTEVNNMGFEIERQADNKTKTDWKKVGFIAGAGNSNSVKEYSFVDKNPGNGEFAYRLKQVDNDGTFEYSNEVFVNLSVPREFGLDQNYPNPFNPSTNISFSIPEAGFATLKVFNTLGEEIAELVNGQLEAGVHTVNFDAGSLASGLYIYKLNVDGKFHSEKKMNLLK